MTHIQNAIHNLETLVGELKNNGNLSIDFFSWLQSQVPSFEAFIEKCKITNVATDFEFQIHPYSPAGECASHTPVPELVVAESEPQVHAESLSLVSSENPAVEASAHLQEAAPTQTATHSKQTSPDSHVRVPLSKVDHVLSSVWEVFMTRNQLSYLIDLSRPLLQQDSTLMRHWEVLDSSLRRTIGELESQVMEMRMVPVSGIFERMGRVVNQFSRESSKKIVFESKGDTIEVDKKIVDSLADPLIHLVRNAMDHGIEQPDLRMQNGKSDTGRIQLEATVNGTELIVSVIDDGRGMNPQVLREKALSKGLLHVADWDDKQILNVIFESGFSTAEKVSEISGRGVGMDAVRTQVQALSGGVEVFSELGKGSRFEIRIPLSVSVLNCLVCEINNVNYAIPNVDVLEAYTVPRKDIRFNGDEAYYNFQDKPLKLIDLSQYFTGYKASVFKVINREISLLIVNGPSKEKYALVVSKISHNQEIVSKPPPVLGLKIPYVSGVSILADGRPIFMLSAPKLVQHFFSGKSREGSAYVSVA